MLVAGESNVVDIYTPQRVNERVAGVAIVAGAYEFMAGESNIAEQVNEVVARGSNAAGT